MTSSPSGNPATGWDLTTITPALTAITFTSTPPGASMTVDGTSMTTPFTIPLTRISHSVTATGLFPGSTGTQYVFNAWGDSVNTATRAITVGPGQPTTYTVSYTTQYQLTTAASPPAGGSVTPSSGAYYNAGTSVNVGATASPGYSFASWSGAVASPNSASTSVTMTAPVSVTANFFVPKWSLTKTHTGNFSQGQIGAAYVLTATNSGTGSTRGPVTVTDTLPIGLSVASVNGINWNCGGSVASVSCTRSDALAPGQSYEPINLTVNVAPNAPGSVINQATVSGGEGGSANASDPTTILTAITFTSTPAGATVTVDGTPATTPFTTGLSVGTHTISSSAVFPGTTGTRYVFAAWGDSVNTAARTITVGPGQPTTYAADYSTQYQLTTAVSPAGSGSINPPSGAFYSAGTAVGLTAAPSPGFIFSNWSGPVSSANSASTTMTITAPLSVTANFRFLSRANPRDFRGVGRSDALIYNPLAGDSYTALSNGDGSFTYVGALFLPGFEKVRTGDIDGDGRADLVVYNPSNESAYLGRGRGDGAFIFQSLFWSPGYDVIEAADFNADGKTDFLLHRSNDGTSYTAVSNGDGTFAYRYTLVSIGFTHVRTADFNGDSKTDVFLYRASDGLAFRGLSNGDGSFTFASVAAGTLFDAVQTGDINGDGKADLLLYHAATGTTRTGISNGTGFTFFTQYYSPNFTAVRLLDLNGDGKSDIVLYNKNNTLGYFGIGNGDNTFNFGSVFWGPGMDTIDPQDLNGDGKADIVLYNGATGTAYSGIGNGSGGFAYSYSYWGIGKLLAR